MYRRKPEGWLKHLDFIVIDMLCLIVAYMASYIIRHSITDPFSDALYATTAVMMLLLTFFTSIVFEINKGVLRRGYYLEFVTSFKNTVMIIMMTVLYLFLVKEPGYSRLMMGWTGIFFLVLSFTMKSLWKVNIKKKNLILLKEHALFIVTTKKLLGRLEENIKNDNYGGYQITGIAVIDADLVGTVVAGVPVVANRYTVEEYVCHTWVDEIFINIPNTDEDGEVWIDKFLEMGIVVHLRIIHASELNKNNQFIERLGKYTVLTTTLGTMKLREIMIKRTMDIVAGIIGTMIAGILTVIVGPILYIKSPGPIFFAQTRMGKNGHPFKIYKFRSMYMDAEERKKEMLSQNQMGDARMVKIPWDTRIIGSEKGKDKGFGNFIRKYSIDEWPQFFNILKGDMSLVGTRPPTMDEWEQYESHHRARLAMKPGLTGLWQVSGRSSIVDFEEVVKLDVKYIRGWNLGLDIKIILKTIVVVFKHEGAM